MLRRIKKKEAKIKETNLKNCLAQISLFFTKISICQEYICHCVSQNPLAHPLLYQRLRVEINAND